MKPLLLLAGIVVLCGCARPVDHPVPPNCVWSEEDNRQLDLAKISDRRHLRFDAVTAEDVAIRWTDIHFGHRPEWDDRCRECRELLFQGVAEHHGVDAATVRQYSRQRDLIADTAVILSFGVLYAIVAYVFAGRIGRRFPPGEPGFWVMTVAMAIGISLVGVLAGGLWAIVVEEFRMGSGHLSYRMNRIPFRHYWALVWVCGFIVFTAVALIRSRLRGEPSADCV